MFKASQENFLKVYLSEHRVQTEVYLMNDLIVEWYFTDSGDTMFTVSPETYHQY
jgi:hypothetical protein